MAKHRDLGEAELHEPKGIAPLTGGASDAGKVVKAVGDGTSTADYLDWEELTGTPTRTVVVNSAADLPAPVAGVITLQDRVQYLIADNFSIGTDRLVMSAFTVIRGIDQDNARIEYLGTGNMLTYDDVTTLLQDVTLSAQNGTYFDFNDTTGSFFHMIDVQLDDDGIIGTFDSTGNANILIKTMIGGSHPSGMTFTGNFSTCTIKIGSGTITGTGVMFDLGTATFTSFDLDSDLCVIGAAGATFLSGAAASANINSGGLGRLSNCTIINAGGGTILSGIDPDDTKWRFLNNLGIRNSRPDALSSFTSNATATTITTAATPVKINATWTDNRKSQFTHNTNGTLTFVGDADMTLPIGLVVNAQMVAGGGSDLKIYIAINGSVVGVGIPLNGVTTSKPVSGSTIWQAVLSTNDTVEAWIENTTDTNNITVTDAILRVN